MQGGRAAALNRAVDLAVDVGSGDQKAVDDAKSFCGLGSGSALGQPDATSDGGAEGDGSNLSDKDPAKRQSAVSAMAAAEPTDAAPVNAPEKPSVPEIALNYHSARKTRLGGLYQGWLGYAWGLDGFDVIERASPGYGYPAFTSSDVYLLNGEELVSCTSGMTAASCSSGGTHVTEVENFNRVVFNSSANTWTVTDRDSTQSLFKSVQVVFLRRQDKGVHTPAGVFQSADGVRGIGLHDVTGQCRTAARRCLTVGAEWVPISSSIQPATWIGVIERMDGTPRASHQV